MAKRKVGQELIEGLKEIHAWQRGETKLKTQAVELPKGVQRKRRARRLVARKAA